MISLKELRNENAQTHRIEYKDEKLGIDCWFICTLPSSQLKKKAGRNSTAYDKQGRQEVDPTKFAESIFVPCVKEWSFPEEPTDEEKKTFLQPEFPVLNKIAQFVSLKLFQLTETSTILEEGN